MRFNLMCTTWPNDKLTKKAKKFGEGFTWTCPDCHEQRVLVQGKGTYWTWKKVKSD